MGKYIEYTDWEGSEGFKEVIITSKNLGLQYKSDLDNYDVWAEESSIVYAITLKKGTADAIDFENIYKSSANGPDYAFVDIKEEDVRTGGHYQIKDLVCNVPAGNVGDWTEHDFTWPIPISLLSAGWAAVVENDGDEVEVFIAPYTVIGALTADEAAGQTVLDVGSTVTDNLQIGYWVTITDGTNTEDLGMCLGVDKTAGTITVENALANSYLAATPTYIQQTVKFCPTKHLKGSGYKYDVGQTKIGGSNLPAGKQVRIRYKSNGTTARKFCVGVEYLY